MKAARKLQSRSWQTRLPPTGEGAQRIFGRHRKPDRRHQDGTGLHPRAPGERHRSDSEIDLADPDVVEHSAGSLHVLPEDRVRIAVEKQGCSVDMAAAASVAPMTKGVSPPSVDEIRRSPGPNPKILQLALRVFGMVLEPFDRPDQGGVSARHEADHVGVRCAGKKTAPREQFERDREASGGTGIHKGRFDHLFRSPRGSRRAARPTPEGGFRGSPRHQRRLPAIARTPALRSVRAQRLSCVVSGVRTLRVEGAQLTICRNGKEIVREKGGHLDRSLDGKRSEPCISSAESGDLAGNRLLESGAGVPE